MPRRVAVRFEVTREVAFDCLVDPHNRMEWQSSLRVVEDVDPMPAQVGTRWRERATGGMVSEMRLPGGRADAVLRPGLLRAAAAVASLNRSVRRPPLGCCVRRRRRPRDAPTGASLGWAPRTALLAEAAYRRQVWRAVTNPGLAAAINENA